MSCFRLKIVFKIKTIEVGTKIFRQIIKKNREVVTRVVCLGEGRGASPLGCGALMLVIEGCNPSA